MLEGVDTVLGTPVVRPVGSLDVPPSMLGTVLVDQVTTSVVSIVVRRVLELPAGG